MKSSGFHSTDASTSGRSNSTSPASQKPAKRKVALDEIQAMAGNGKLETFLDALGIPAAPVTDAKVAKRRMGAGSSFDRETFDQAAYDKHLLEGGK